ncbi:MAG: two-component system response regulator [Verrucomicrobia bacterium]|nr:two-component system response regulator [Verrucomicrobiota bacterium]
MKPITILLVEDEESSAFFFQHVMTKLEMPQSLQVAQDGQEALDYLDGKGRFRDRITFPIPGLIVLDLKMPRVTGFEVLGWIRKQPELRKLIVIVMSTSASDSDINQAYELGANAYVVKPSGLDELAEVLRSIQHFWLAHNRGPIVRVSTVDKTNVP